MRLDKIRNNGRKNVDSVPLRVMATETLIDQSPSHAAANKKSARPEYQMQDSGSGDGVSLGISYIVCQRQTEEAVLAGSRNGKGKHVGVSKNRK